jgi:Ca2+-binding RTX toxin-like protein
MSGSEQRGSAIECLEQRRLLSGSAGMVGDELRITGTEGRDVIVVWIDKTDPTMLDVRVGRERSSFDGGAVSRIAVDALGGNDSVTIRHKNGAIYTDCVIDAGEGNDTVVTGSGNDIVEGGAGNDRVSGGAGDDMLVGAAGNDRLLGGDDNDQLDAGDGKDKLDGAAGDDNLDGGAGADAIVAGDGSNRVAVDQSNAGEVRDKDQSANSTYELANVDTLPASMVTVIDEINQHVPDVHVVRAEVEGENYSVYYRFGTDPELQKVVLSVIGDQIELVNRQVSLQEARPVARAAFDSDHPNLGIVSLFQHPHGTWDVRVRNHDGGLETITTTDIVWGLDDVERDLNNDGRDDGGGDPGVNG